MKQEKLLHYINKAKIEKTRSLDLYFVGLTELPEEIGNLTHLETLDLRGNRLSALPSQISNLTSLQRLDLQGNQITVFPMELLELKNLKELDLRKNKLTSIPSEVAYLTKLLRIDIGDNPLTFPPNEIVVQGTKAVLTYLRQQLQDSTKQWVSKLIVVGEGGVGKTSLLRALRGETFNIQESTTHGIAIESLLLNHPFEKDVIMQLNTWDFGGQEIYHATHQFFLTNRSLFILAWNARLGFEQGKLYYWLDTIKARAPESPVILVATYIDERDAKIPLADLRRKYPQIVASCEVSNKTGDGIEQLLKEIAIASAELPLMGETWPTNWLNASNYIREKAKEENHITPKRLLDMMAEHGVDQEQSIVLAQWMHELGDILYFHWDDELNDTVILNPQWVTESISKVLVSDEVINNLGLFTRDHMSQLWKDIEPSMRDHFLRLMEKFDLSYRTLENREISLVVERLSLDPPNYEKRWNEIKEMGSCNEISMKFKLDTTLPAGIPTWFIARSHRFTTKTHWRYGAVFADGKEQRHLGLIQVFPHDRYVFLSVRGSTPHNFFALLWDGLEVTLKRFPGINIDRKIPCRGHGGRDCTYEFDFVHLQRAIEKDPPVSEIQCPVTFESVSIPRLMFGLHWNLRNESLATQYNTILSKMEHLSGGLEELSTLTQREFTKVFYREQSRIDSYCPNVFVLRPSESNTWLNNIFGQKMRLQLYCQEPGQWHPTDETGIYEINRPSEWLATMSPYIRRMVSVLKYAAPLIGPWIAVGVADLYEQGFKNDIKLMEELVKKLPDIKHADIDAFEDPRLSVTFMDSYMERAEGAALRTLRNFLEEKDPQQRWGGLRRTLTPEGHYLWLCQHHAIKYTR